MTDFDEGRTYDANDNNMKMYLSMSKVSFDERKNADPKDKKSLCTLVNF